MNQNAASRNSSTSKYKVTLEGTRGEIFHIVEAVTWGGAAAKGKFEADLQASWQAPHEVKSIELLAK